MIDHVTITVKDIDATKKFYEQALAPLGYEVGLDETAEDGGRFVGFWKDKKFDTWFTTYSNRPPSGPAHVCWKAASRDEVDAFYYAAIAAGGKDNGEPGIRKEYGEKYYGGFVIDPDGNNVEAVFGN